MFLPQKVYAGWSGSGTYSLSADDIILNWGRATQKPDYNLGFNFSANTSIANNQTIPISDSFSFNLSSLGSLIASGGWSDTPQVFFPPAVPPSEDGDNDVGILPEGDTTTIGDTSIRAWTIDPLNRYEGRNCDSNLPASQRCHHVSGIGAYSQSTPTLQLSSSNTSVITCSGTTCTAQNPGSATITVSVASMNVKMILTLLCLPGNVGSNYAIIDCPVRYQPKSLSTGEISLGSLTVNVSGSVTPTPTSEPPTPTPTPTPPSNQPPNITNATISPKPVTADGSTQYTITLTGSDPDGGNDISTMYTRINTTGDYRGYIGWTAEANFPNWTSTKDLLINCGGGSQAAINTSNRSTWGDEYVELLSCSAPVVIGNNRTVTLTVAFNTNFITPTTNNSVWGYVRDWSEQEDIPSWQQFDTFDLSLSPTATPTTIPPTPTPTTVPPTPTPTTAPTFSISGNVFVDTNSNKVKDGAETNYSATPNITKSPAGGSITNNPDGSYTITGLSAGVYTVSYNSLPVGYSMVHPQAGPPPSFSVTVGPGCTASPVPAGSCDGANNVNNLNFAINNSSAWMQTYDLDVRSDNGFTDAIPAGTPYTSYASAIDSLSNTPGVIFTGDGSSNFGTGQASSTGWTVGGAYPEVFSFPSGNRLHTSYGYLLDNATRAGITPTDMATVCGGGGLANCNLDPGLANGIYKANGKVMLNANTFNVNKNYVFLINGTLTIVGNIIVPNGSTALFSSAGDVIIDRAVGAASNAFPRPAGQLQGFYSADRTFIIDGINNCSSGTDKMLNIEGALVANAAGAGGSITNNRNLCGNNATNPSYTIAPRLDFILNAPSFLMQQSTISNEVAP